MNPSQEILFNQQALDKIGLSISLFNKALLPTFGPLGSKNILEELNFIEDIESQDPIFSIGKSFAIEMMECLAKQCHDGTKTALILLTALTKNGIDLINKGACPFKLLKGMQQANDKIYKNLGKMKIKNLDFEDIKKLAFYFSGSLEIGVNAASYFYQTENTQNLFFEHDNTQDEGFENTFGLVINEGYLSPYFCKNKETQEIVLFKPFVLIANKKIASIHQLIPILDFISKNHHSLLILAEDIEGDALSNLIINTTRGVVDVAAIKLPSLPEEKLSILKQTQALSLASVEKEQEFLLNELNPECLGRLRKVILTKNQTILFQENPLKTVKPLKRNLTVFHLKAPNYQAFEEKKSLYVKTIKFLQNAHQEGLVPGAGMGLVNACSKLYHRLTGDEKIGFELFQKATVIPALTLIENANENPNEILKKLSSSPNLVFNNLTNTIEETRLSYIYDSVKVIRMALFQALKTAEKVFLSEALISNKIGKI
jgi:chaperonin GroEL